MLSRTTTVSFQGIDTIKVTVEVQVASGLPAFKIVGLADKSVAESSERVRGALTSMGLALPAKRITVNLAPADVTKDGSHFDLPIAVGLLSAMGIIPPEEIENYVVLGELGLGGEIAPVAGVLPAAMAANQYEKGIICPKTQINPPTQKALNKVGKFLVFGDFASTYSLYFLLRSSLCDGSIPCSIFFCNALFSVFVFFIITFQI